MTERTMEAISLLPLSQRNLHMVSHKIGLGASGRRDVSRVFVSFPSNWILGLGKTHEVQG